MGKFAASQFAPKQSPFTADPRQNKQACVISYDALWILAAAARPVADIDGIGMHEQAQIYGACAAAHRAMNASMYAPTRETIEALRDEVTT